MQLKLTRTGSAHTVSKPSKRTLVEIHSYESMDQGLKGNMYMVMCTPPNKSSYVIFQDESYGIVVEWLSRHCSLNDGESVETDSYDAEDLEDDVANAFKVTKVTKVIDEVIYSVIKPGESADIKNNCLYVDGFNNPVFKTLRGHNNWSITISRPLNGRWVTHKVCKGNIAGYYATLASELSQWAVNVSSKNDTLILNIRKF